MKYVALLRAVNVGGRIVKMDRLRTLFEELPFRNVSTFIASGNVLFDSTAAPPVLERRIEKHLESALGYAVPTMVRSADEVTKAAAHTPFPSEPVPAIGGLYVGFLKSAPDKKSIEKVLALADALNAFQFKGREVYWLARERMAVLKMNAAKFDRALGVSVTFRNVTTVRKLAALCERD